MFSNSVLLSQGCLGDFESFTFFHVNPGVNFGICYDLQKKSAGIVDLCMLKIPLCYTHFSSSYIKMVGSNNSSQGMVWGKLVFPKAFWEVCKVKTFPNPKLEGDVI